MLTPWLASWPKCGNTMTRILLEHHFAIPVIDGDHEYTREKIPIDTPYREDILFYKTHELKHPPNTTHPALMLVRDPRDAWVSWAHHNLHVSGVRGTVESELENYAHGKLRTKGTMTMFYKAWLARLAPTTVLRYEDIVSSPEPHVVISEALTKIGIEHELVNPTPAPSFAQLHERIPSFFRRGIIGSHKDEMSPEIRAVVEEQEAWVMALFDYERT